MQTPEEKSQLARENGSKSHGPTTEEGKEKSRRNGIQHGRYAQLLANLVPPHSAVLCNEERQRFYSLLDCFTREYQPKNNLGMSIVRDLTIAQWNLDRIYRSLSAHWNMAILEQSKEESDETKQLHELRMTVELSNTIYGPGGPGPRLEREIDRYLNRIARLRRSLRLIQKEFPAQSLSELDIEKRTDADSAQPVENTSSEPEKTPKPEPAKPPIYITEDTQKVRAACQINFPGHPIVVLPADNVGLGIEEPDDVPRAPRKAA